MSAAQCAQLTTFDAAVSHWHVCRVYEFNAHPYIEWMLQPSTTRDAMHAKLDIKHAKDSLVRLLACTDLLRVLASTAVLVAHAPSLSHGTPTAPPSVDPCVEPTIDCWVSGTGLEIGLATHPIHEGEHCCIHSTSCLSNPRHTHSHAKPHSLSLSHTLACPHTRHTHELVDTRQAHRFL
jgi:hypothetical protein